MELPIQATEQWLTTKEAALYFNISSSAFRRLLRKNKALIADYIKEVSSQGGQTHRITKKGLVILANIKDGDRGNKDKIIPTPSVRLQAKKNIAEHALAPIQPKFSLGEPLGLGFMPLPTVQLKEISKRNAIWNIISQLVNNPSDAAEYKTWYGRIYRQLLARYGVNIEAKARHRGIKAIQQVEDEGLIEEAYAIAYKFLSDSQKSNTHYLSPYEQ